MADLTSSDLATKIRERIAALEWDEATPDRVMRIQYLETVQRELEAGHYTVDDALEALKAAADIDFGDKRKGTNGASASDDAADEEEEKGEEQAEKLAQIDKLVRLVVERAFLFHAPGLSRYDFYADISVNGCRETHYIGSSSLNRWMLSSYYATNRKALGQAVVDGANGVLRALAEQGPEMTVDVRTSQHKGKFYIDLGDKTWRAVEVSTAGWKVVKAPPVRFKRGGAMAPLCEPKTGGSLELLRGFLNLKDEDSFVMLVAWLLDRAPTGGTLSHSRHQRGAGFGGRAR